MEKFKEAYNAHLANGVGNLTSRIMKMAEAYDVLLKRDISVESIDKANSIPDSHKKYYDAYEINQACNDIWNLIQHTDKLIQTEEPFKTIKRDEKQGKAQILRLLLNLYTIALLLRPILPETSRKILGLIETGKAPAEPLFMRK